MRKPLRALAVVAVVMLAACSGGGGGAKVDPYDVYLAHNPRPDLVLSREDAQTRALLGCGKTFAPGTVDAVLTDAYRGLC